MLTYLGYYPHYSGTFTARVELDETLVALLLAIAADEGKDGFDARETLDVLIDDIVFVDEKIRNLEEEEREVIRSLVKRTGNSTTAFQLQLLLVDGLTDDNKRASKVLNALKTKGYWAGEWEEGSHSISLPGKEIEAKAAMFYIEARHFADQFEIN